MNNSFELWEKKYFSRLFSWFVITVLCVQMICAGNFSMTSNAAETTSTQYYGKFEYVNSGSEITITSYFWSDRTDTVIEIPDEIGGIPVTGINDNAFAACNRVAVNCSENSYAYNYMVKYNIIKETPEVPVVPVVKTPAKKGTILTVSSTELKSIVIPSKVKKIGTGAFYGCKSIKKITMTAGKLKTVGKNAFKGINKKATITVKGTKKAKATLTKKLKKKTVGYVKTWKLK